jgi:hypothetical protein
MADFDVAIVGSSLFSGLLAGILARDHGRKVARVGRRRSPQRLPRGLDLGLPLATRPATWALLRQAEAETRTLLGSMGVSEGLGTTEAAAVADLPASVAALDHVAHLAAGYGYQVRRSHSGWAFRSVSMLDREAVEARLGDWLNATGVTAMEEGTAGADLTVLGDDAAIFDHVPEGQRPPLLISQAMTGTLVVSPRALPTRLQRFVDRGVTLLARPGNTVLALVGGEVDVEARLASTLPGPFPIKRLATTRYRCFVTADSAPFVGRLKLGKQFIAAGLGTTAAFLAPAIARHLVGKSDADEARWFAAHDPAQPREAIAEFVAPAEVAP